MRIHSDVINYTQQLRDLLPEGVKAQVVNPHRSRKRANAYEVQLHGTSGRRTQSGSGIAASWDEWGAFIAGVFALDAAAIVGPYDGADFFHWTTDDRFRSFDIEEQHRRHRWSYVGPVATRSYSVHECPCGSLTRTMSRGYSFADINN